MSFANEYFNEVIDIANAIDKNKVEELVNALVKVRDVTDGRVFVLGVGGSAGNASHLVNDLRKLCGIEAYAPTDNVSELTARTNDEGFDTIFSEYLNISKFRHNDVIFILSVGGGDEDKNVSVNLIEAIKEANEMHGTVLGIVGKKNGYTALHSDVVVVVPELSPKRVTPHSEAFQSVVWHCIVSHPKLQIKRTKW